MGNSPSRNYLYWAIAHLVEGYYFQVHGAFEETAHPRGHLEESRVVALVLLFTHVLELYKFDI